MVYYKKKWFLDAVILVDFSQTKPAALKLENLGRIGHYSGLENYKFISVDLEYFSTSYRVFKNGKSLGYIDINSFRNGAVINFVEKGSYSFYYEGLFSGKWILRKDLFLLEGSKGEIFLHEADYEGLELLIACSLFVLTKIKRDLLLIAPFILLFIIFLLLV